jgi:hypothetical protein
MKKQIWTSLVAALVIAAGSARLATPAHAATTTSQSCAFTVFDLIDISDAICGGGNWSATDISCDGDTMSWTLSCS